MKVLCALSCCFPSVSPSPVASLPTPLFAEGADIIDGETGVVAMSVSLGE